MKAMTLQQRWYYQMLRIRMLEERIAHEYSSQEIRCPVHLSIGQEAIAVGVCSSLSSQDTIMSTHRSHAHFLAKGGNLSAFISELYGKSTGVSGGYGGSQHIIDQSVGFLGATPIVASTIPLAVGVSFALKGRQENNTEDFRISVVFFGEAAMEEGVVHEVINFSVLQQLPVLFICEQNYYAVNTHIKYRQPRTSWIGLAKAHGLKTDAGDGNIVWEVAKKTKTMVNHIRKGNGPGFLEFVTYRHLEHCGPGRDTGQYRSEKEQSLWKDRDPIDLCLSYLKEKNMYENQVDTSMREDIKREIDDAFLFAKESPYPKRLIDAYAI